MSGRMNGTKTLTYVRADYFEAWKTMSHSIQLCRQVIEACWLLEEGCQAWAVGPHSVKPCQSEHAAAPGAFILSTTGADPSPQSPQAHQRLIFHASGPAGEAHSQGQVGGRGGLRMLVSQHLSLRRVSSPGQ